MKKLLLLFVIITILFPTVYSIRWTLDKRLTDDPEISESHDIAVDQLGRVHVVWRSNFGTKDASPFLGSGMDFEAGEIYYLQINNDGKIVV